MASRVNPLAVFAETAMRQNIHFNPLAAVNPLAIANPLAVVADSQTRHSMNVILRNLYEGNQYYVHGADTVDKWLMVYLLDAYRLGKCNVGEYEWGSRNFFLALISLEHLHRLYPDGFPQGPLPRMGGCETFGGRVPRGPVLPWFRNRKLNRHLRHPTFSQPTDSALPKKVQTSQVQKRLFPVDLHHERIMFLRHGIVSSTSTSRVSDQ